MMMTQKKQYAAPVCEEQQVMLEQALLAGSIVGTTSTGDLGLGVGGDWSQGGGVNADVRGEHPAESNIW